MQGSAFVSFSAEDKVKVETLTQSAPKGLFRLYTHDFRDGASLLSEMERHVRGCSIFIFLASKDSLGSVWCNHEISTAQIESIRRGIKIVALALDTSVEMSDLPAWMRGFWMPAASDLMPPLRRRFLDLLEENCAPPQFAGLHTRVDRVQRGETVFVRCRSGFFDDNRDLLPWAKSFFTQCAVHSQIRVVVVSNRLPR
jgi:hypothetical protein